MNATIRIAQNPDADRFLAEDALALLVGTLLDQQVPMEWAFTGPHTIAERIGRPHWNATDIADYDPDRFAAVLSEKPAVHRYPGSMAGRIQQLCRHLVDHYAADPAAVWRDAGSGRELLTRLKALPGYGPQKSQIMVALLGKRLDIRPDGWREAAGAYGEPGSHRSAADVTGPESLHAVREFKQQAKKAARG